MIKALIITSVASMVEQFLLPSAFLLQDMGYEVHVACNFENGNTCSPERIECLKSILDSRGIEFYQIDFARNVMRFSQNVRAYKQISKIISETDFELVHCHSPIGGLIGRLASKKLRKKGVKVIYTAHGFHFYKKAPLKNWILYYPVEKLCARYTDVLVTINQEDYALAKNKMKARRVEYVPGVGIDLSRFEIVKEDIDKKRREIGVPENAFLMLSVGELNDNKNHQIIIRALSALEKTNVYYVVAGLGEKKEELIALAEDLALSDRVRFVGYRKDIPALINSADLFCFPSIREGLPVSLMEAMAGGLPIVCSKIRGNTDLVDENGGALFDPYSVDECINAIKHVMNSDIRKMGCYNKAKVERFGVQNVISVMRSIYESELR